MSIWLNKDEENFSLGTKVVLIADRQSKFFINLGFILIIISILLSAI